MNHDFKSINIQENHLFNTTGLDLLDGAHCARNMILITLTFTRMICSTHNCLDLLDGAKHDLQILNNHVLAMNEGVILQAKVQRKTNGEYVVRRAFHLGRLLRA
jgi:hypothetical protein